ncbi:hypothetical protein [Methylacidimicrobium sp. B4]|uniref:hypothetical protein n=1 Tax=Methylacidimicrobium sp. B4 TaxID=2796139 RepID=UPI001A8FB495|nr:hypothetical protein [Methylacidimicrobium sp. B4]QSR85006.1 hypothetical protein MacB4_01670 [Methylacidimicrobium sp. B4]
MHEVNGFAILNEAEAALVLGPSGEGGAKVIRIAAPSFSRSGLAALCREADSLPDRVQPLAQAPDLGTLLAQRLEQTQRAQEARSDSAACRATALALRDPRWQSNPAVLRELAHVTDRRGRPCASLSEPDDRAEKALDGEQIPSFEEFVSSVHRSLPSDQRRLLADVYDKLASAYQSRSDALLRDNGLLSGAEEALQQPGPWEAKGYYRPMRDGRERVLADAQGRIFFEHVSPAAPTRWARKAAKRVALACGSKAENADHFAERFRFFDIVSGELRAGAENAASHFFHFLASKKVTDPYARAFAIVFWSVKDFFDSRSGLYPDVASGTAIRESAGKAAALLALPQERAIVEEALGRAERQAGAQERQIEATLLRNGWSSAERRMAHGAPVTRGCDRSG